MPKLDTVADWLPSWFLAARCADADPEVFFPERGQSCDAAYEVCAACPVRAQCLDWATAEGFDVGVFGGVNMAGRTARRAAA